MAQKVTEVESWKEASTLEEWVSRALAEGRDEEVIKAIRSLPEASREKYREVWKRVKGRKRA